MKLERIQKYRMEIASTQSNQWPAILLRMVTEARNERGDDNKKELENTRLKLTIALGALETYADETAFNDNEKIEEITHLARLTLDKIKKVDWLTDNRPAELG